MSHRRAGPWGTGPFTLAEGHSSLDTEQAVIGREPFVECPLGRHVVAEDDLLQARADIVTEIPSADAARVERSRHAKLVSVNAVRAIAGVINRDAEGLPLSDRRARRALNLAIDRGALVREAMFGHAARSPG